MRKSNEKWVGHLLKRFGAVPMDLFGRRKWGRCPCKFLKRSCEDCKHRARLFGRLINWRTAYINRICRHGRAWNELPLRRREIIKANLT